MEQSLSWEADSSAASIEIPKFYGKKDSVPHAQVLATCSILRQMNQVHVLIPLLKYTF